MPFENFNSVDDELRSNKPTTPRYEVTDAQIHEKVKKFIVTVEEE